MKKSKVSEPPEKAGVSLSAAPQDTPRAPYEITIALQYAILALVTLSIVLNSLDAIKLNQLAKVVMRQNPTVGEVLKKLTKHSEAKGYFGAKPKLFIRVDQNNFEILSRQVPGMDVFWIGNYLLVYNDKLFVYNFEEDKVLTSLQISITQPPPGAPPPALPAVPHP